MAQHFVHENRIRQAASSLGAADYCVRESVKYARERKPFGEDLARNQGIQFPLVELATQVEMLRLLIRKTAWQMDQMPKPEVEKRLSDKVSMCNYWANRLCCEAADRAMQVHGGLGYSRHKPFEHIYRHHRRYRITEGPRRSRCARWPGTCSATWARTSSELRSSNDENRRLQLPGAGPRAFRRERGRWHRRRGGARAARSACSSSPAAR